MVVLCLVGLLYPGISPGKEKKTSVTVLPLPTRGIAPPIQDVILATVARLLRTEYSARVLSGRAVGRSVWGTLGSGLEDAAMHFTEKVEAGQRAYRLLQIDEALVSLNEAANWEWLCGPEIRNTEMFTDLFLYTGLAWLAKEKAAKADKAFRQAVAYNPELTLSTRKFPPDVVEAFNRAKKQVMTRNPTMISFASRPNGATIYVDGKFRGTTPTSGVSLYPGRHYIRLELEGYSPWTLNVPPTAHPKQIKAKMIPLWTGDPPEDLLASVIAAERFDEAQLAELRLLAGFFRADALVMVHITMRDGDFHLGTRVFVVRPEIVMRARLFNLGGNPREFERKIQGVVGTMKPLEQAAGTKIAAINPVGPKNPKTNLTDPDPKNNKPIVDPVIEDPRKGWKKNNNGPVTTTPWYKRWWFWTLVGLAAAGAATGVTLYLLQPEGNWTLVVRPH
jgi:hypothetical protein